MERPKQEDIIEWAQMPQTRWALQKAKEAQDELKENIVDGATLAESSGATAQLTARIIGEIRGVGWFKTFLEEEINSDS